MTFIVRRMISDMKHRQAGAQWPGYTYRRADSNAVRVLLVAWFGLAMGEKNAGEGVTYVDEGPCRSLSRIAAP